MKNGGPGVLSRGDRGMKRTVDEKCKQARGRGKKGSYQVTQEAAEPEIFCRVPLEKTC